MEENSSSASAEPGAQLLSSPDEVPKVGHPKKGRVYFSLLIREPGKPAGVETIRIANFGSRATPWKGVGAGRGLDGDQRHRGILWP